MFCSKNLFETISDKEQIRSEKLVLKEALPKDTSDIILLIKKLRKNTDIFEMDFEIDSTAFRALLKETFKGNGICIIAEQQKKLVGVIFGIVNTPLWNKNYKSLDEIAFYSKTKRAGYLLLDNYLSKCAVLKNNSKIQSYSISEIHGISPKYDRFNMIPVETKWIAK